MDCWRLRGFTSSKYFITGLALLALGVLTGCSVRQISGTPSVYPANQSDEYEIPGQFSHGVLIYSLDVNADVNETEVDLNRTSMSDSGPFDPVRTTTWTGMYNHQCVNSLGTTYRVRYFIFPFIPGEAIFGERETVITRTVATVSITPQPILATRTRRFGLTVQDTYSCTIMAPSVTWTTSNPKVATVDALGNVRGVDPGPVTITAESGGITDSVSITVGPAPTLSSLEITEPPSPLVMEINTDRQLSVTGTWSDGLIEDMTYSIGTTYSTSNSSIASVTPSGRVRGRSGPGNSTISVSNAGVSDQVSVQVLAPFVSLEVTPNPIALSPANPQITLTLTGVRSDGSRNDVSSLTGAALVSENPSILSAEGQTVVLLRGRGKGTVRGRYLSTTGYVYGNASVCNMPAQPGAFSENTGSSTDAPTFRRETLSNQEDRVTIVKDNDQTLDQFILDKYAGDQIRVYSFGRKFIVVVHTLGADYYRVVYQGGEYVVTDQTPFEGIKRVYLYNAQAQLGYQEDDQSQIIDQSDLLESDDVKVYFSQDGQVVNILADRSGRNQNNFTRFYASFDQETLLRDENVGIRPGGVYQASLTFNTSTCNGTISWSIDNPPSAQDDSGSGEFHWPSAGVKSGSGSY